ncbi:hypothetical protein SAMN05444161_4732 [Rhizobiales bacterium GAS191]|nr:hypothetical protein SAMN05444161_4732 [Rhizobiales bacterium GAS191]
MDQWQFTRFVTLATNDPALASAQLPTSRLPYGVLRQRLRAWDARINHAILGKFWARLDADRIWAFYFLEKPHSNPHWHGLIRFFPVDNMSFADQEQILDTSAEKLWKELVPSGTVDVTPITRQRGVIEYVSKMLGFELSYEHFVTPDELKLG